MPPDPLGLFFPKQIHELTDGRDESVLMPLVYREVCAVQDKESSRTTTLWSENAHHSSTHTYITSVVLHTQQIQVVERRVWVSLTGLDAFHRMVSPSALHGRVTDKPRRRRG
jgi:hypothetical protein